MVGKRKLIVFGVCIAALVAGLALSKDSSVYTPFAAAVVAIGGWFFKANVDAKKVGPGAAP